MSCPVQGQAERGIGGNIGFPLPHKHQVAGAPLPPTLLAVYMPADIPVEVDIPLPKKLKDNHGAHILYDPMEDMFNQHYM